MDQIQKIVAALERVGAEQELAEHKRFEPASIKDLKELEEHIKKPLPIELREFLQLNQLGLPFMGNYNAQSIKSIIRDSKRTAELFAEGTFKPHTQKILSWNDGRFDDERMVKAYWTPCWVAFAEDSCGNQIVLTPGQDPGAESDSSLIWSSRMARGPTCQPFRI